MAKKKKTVNPARGFATTSIPSKPKVSAEPEPPPAPVEPTAPADPPASSWEPPAEPSELLTLVTKSGPKVRRESARIVAKADTEKRTLRAVCYPLRVERVLAYKDSEATAETVGEKILRLAREEYISATRKEDLADLTPAWTVHRVLLGLGFERKAVEDAVAAVMTREGMAKKEVETLLEECLEWGAMFWEGEVGRYGDGVAAGVKKAPAGGSGTTTPKEKEREPAKDKRHLALPRAAAQSESFSPALKHTIRHSSLITEISNLELESKDVSDRGSDPAASESDEERIEEEESEEEEELTPENLVPMYLTLQTKLYNIHPNCASVIVGGKKAKGGGKKPTKSPPQLPPKSLSDKERATVKRLQQKLADLERDPLFDSYTADTAWRDERAKLDEESWANKKSKPPKPPPKKPSAKEKALQPSPSPPPPAEEDEGIMGMLFDGPPTEEQAAAGENVAIRNFEEALVSTTASWAQKGGKGKAGVGAPAMRKLVQEICKSRDVNAKARFDAVSGTSFSNRSKLTITWSSSVEIEPTPPVQEGEAQPDVLVSRPQEEVTVFEMKKLAAATADQADGFIVTYALHKLFAKKEEKLYLRLPTVWRNVWAELVEEDKNRSEAEEVKALEKLQELLKVESPLAEETASKQAIPTPQIDGEQADAPERKYKAAYEQYMESEDIKEGWERRRNSPAFLQMEHYRQTLPMWSFRRQVIEAVEANPVVVLSGETGCGKSTQLPTFLLEHELASGRACKIYCTQPRRISAISLARRVAEEMGEGKGRVGGLVGYSIRLENMVTDQTRLVYATTGIVMRMLERSTELADISHLILDEVHERSIESDFLMIVLKRLLIKRKDLKVVLMSATVDAQKFSDYLGGAPVLKVPGRTFPVQEYYLEDAIETTDFKVEDDARGGRSRKSDWDDNDADLDIDSGSGNVAGGLQNYRPETRAALSRIDQYRIPYELILKLLETIATSPQYIEYSKAILIFLPGWGEIRRLNDMILGHPMFGSHGRHSTGGWLVYPLHSSIASEDQEQAFVVPPPGMRKIVLATNIAETGITIPDITAVIDSGKHKEMRFDEKRQLSRLIETFVSRANAKQRRGRAGRVQPGICFHLFTRERHGNWMSDQQTPEIMRLSLQDLVLRVKICKLGIVEEVLGSALDSPTPRNIRRAVESLVDVKALTSQDEGLTPLGRQLAKLPLDVYLGKLVLLGSIFGCLDAALTMAAMLSSKSPFLTGSEADRARFAFKRGDSDLLTGYNAYCAWRRVCSSKTTNITEAEFCRKNYISPRTMSGIEDLKGQLTAAMVDAGFLFLTPSERQALNHTRYQTYRRRNFFIVPDAYNHNSSNDGICNVVIGAAFYPKLLAKDGKGWRNIGSEKGVKIHRSSVNTDADCEWLAYYGIMQAGGGKKTYDAHETGRMEEMGIAVLCGEAEWKMFPGVVAIDGNRIRFSFGDWKSLIAVKVLRNRLAEALRAAWKNPEKELSQSQRAWLAMFQEVMEGVVKVREKN
ncbi:P-loop containing nucleoside triphosphate hydrolase protein [Sphaerosporella brunnea]|uniref:RNA helicase n=1 Tax=Sphaerosporella brunnea TaxID=1250544 RepID=A0A5J5EHH2_9PEZI|nr:P-loop containing nucleoside triphosphate hydrolase protein [Sphaerosporella brunnea]